jgi:hypothetical protein
VARLSVALLKLIKHGTSAPTITRPAMIKWLTTKLERKIKEVIKVERPSWGLVGTRQEKYRSMTMEDYIKFLGENSNYLKRQIDALKERVSTVEARDD